MERQDQYLIGGSEVIQTHPAGNPVNSPRGQALQEWHRSDLGWGGGSSLLSEVTTDAFLVLWEMAPMQSSQRCGLARESQKQDFLWVISRPLLLTATSMKKKSIKPLWR